MSRFGWVLAVVIGGGVGGVSAQEMALGPSTGGIAVLHQAERMLGHTKRVLLIGAHPDDEDTELLTTLVRGEGAEAAYLSLSRGEGGQNLIGPELGEALGLIRTEELLAARALDGARQYFTRAFDFGFSKTIEETARFWPRDSVLKDVVRIVRRFRPQIIIGTFTGTPRDGHGQHQMSGWVAEEAFRVAGDPNRFPELMRQEGLGPWTPVKFYRSARFTAGPATVTLNGGVLDLDIGQSYRQIAMRGRSLHRSQDMGVLQEAGPSEVRLTLVGGEGDGGDKLWSGVDTAAGPLPGESIEARDRHRHAAIAAAIRTGLVFDATGQDGRLVPGQRVMVRLTAWNAGAQPATVEMELLAPSAWRVTQCPSPRVRIEPGNVAVCEVEVEVAGAAQFSSPYFLWRGLGGGGQRSREPQAGAYEWSGDPGDWGEPFETPVLRARFGFSGAAGPGGSGGALGGEGAFALIREVVHRYRDQAIGEVRRPIFIVPLVDVKLTPDVKVWSAGSRAPQQFTVTLQHGAAGRTTGTVALVLPAGWPAVAPQPFSLTREEERETLVFEVRQSGNAAEGEFEIRAVARDSAGRQYDAGLYEVNYPHIRPRVWVKEAVSVVRAAPITLPALARVGYVRGAADRVPEALRGIGLPVEFLDAAALERGDLSRYDVIVVGSRAYETEPALGDNNNRLLDYARAGGRVVVLYQQAPYFNGNFAPAPLRLAQRHDRVADEAAPVELLAPAHPAFTQPNRIGLSDWEGWVQERGLYFARSWDSSYTPLLALSDPGEAALKGGLLIRPVEKGSYIYTGLSFFRQLPAGVVGALRLFLNLLDTR